MKAQKCMVLAFLSIVLISCGETDDTSINSTSIDVKTVDNTVDENSAVKEIIDSDGNWSVNSEIDSQAVLNDDDNYNNVTEVDSDVNWSVNNEINNQVVPNDDSNNNSDAAIDQDGPN